ncbi:hypothetical protein [Kitasatospora paranensis]|uniref:Uncharacterized protein n=1 Tax=Kitasatospora paranensis TaxID=258053 RepID=A0ABW2G737_9ACTN
MQHQVLLISLEPDRVTRLVKSERPAGVVHAGAACLAQMLDGFVRMRSRLAPERRAAGRREVIGLARSKYNRAGQLIECSVDSLTVFDNDLGAWRLSHADLTVTRPASAESIVCASSCPDMSSMRFAVLTDPARRSTKLEQFADHLRETALPWFSSSEDPQNGPGPLASRTAVGCPLRPIPWQGPRQPSLPAWSLRRPAMALPAGL